MTVQEFQADNIETISRLLAHFLETTHDARRDWKPAVEGAAGVRSAHEQVAECIAVNRVFAALLRGETPQPPNPGDTTLPFADCAGAQTMLIESGKELANVIRAMSDEDLSRMYVTRRGPMPGAQIIVLPYRNMAYHSGQINFIQLLYGDTEFRPQPAPKTA